MAGWVRWYFSIVTLPYPDDPSKTLWAFDIRRDTENGEINLWSANYIVTEEWQVDFEVEVGEVDYGADYFRKWGLLWYTDLNLGQRTFSYWEVVVPPFNGLWTEGTAFHAQVHDVGVPPSPPPPIQPPPVPPPIRPTPEKPEPPITEPVEPEPEPPPPCGDLDAETFREFWRQWGHQVDKLAFEVPLDDGVDVPDLPEPWRSVWKHLTHHRIDVVFSRKGSIYVAEIKPRLSIAAIGTAIVARTMFMRRYDVSRFDAVKAAVISQVGSPTLIQAAATHRVVIFLTKGIDGLYEPVALHDVIF